MEVSGQYYAPVASIDRGPGWTPNPVQPVSQSLYLLSYSLKHYALKVVKVMRVRDGRDTPNGLISLLLGHRY